MLFGVTGRAQIGMARLMAESWEELVKEARRQRKNVNQSLLAFIGSCPKIDDSYGTT